MKMAVCPIVVGLIIILPSPSSASWQVPVNLGTVVNSDSADGSPCISPDGGVLFFHSKREGGFGRKDIWTSFRNGDSWDFPLDLGSVVNTEYDETSPSISWSGDTLYFSSDRDGGYGGMDIWCSEREGGSWSEPVNLGTGVNSSSNERNPAVGLLSSILYFASDRSGGYGNSDLWASFREGTSWGEAFNLGWGVNNTTRDGGPSISGEGDELYLDSRRSGGSGRSDFWLSSYGPTLVAEEWVDRYDGPDGLYDCAKAIALDLSANVYVTGESKRSRNSYDYVTIKYRKNPPARRIPGLR